MFHHVPSPTHTLATIWSHPPLWANIYVKDVRCLCWKRCRFTLQSQWCLSVSPFLSSNVALVAWTDCLNMMIETANSWRLLQHFSFLVAKIVSMLLPISGSKWALNCNNDVPVGQLEFDRQWGNVCRRSVSQTKARQGGSRYVKLMSPCPTARLASSWSTSMVLLTWKCSLPGWQWRLCYYSVDH